MNRETYNDTFVKVVAHYLMTDFRLETIQVDIKIAKSISFVDWRRFVPLFPVKAHRVAAQRSLGGLSCNEDDADAVVHPGGPLWLAESHEQHDYIDTGRMLIEGIGLTPSGVNRLLTDKIIPTKFGAAIGFDSEAAAEVKASAAFKKWLVDDWADPTLKGPYERLDLKSSGAAKTALKTSHYVKQISYTPEEAAEASEFIKAAQLSDRSKAAYIAHVTRRIAA